MRTWHNEPWRKLYTRIDGQWLRLSVTARGVADELLKYASEDGALLALREGEERRGAVADLLAPKAREREAIIEAVGELFDDTFLVANGKRVRIRNFVAAQERVTPAALRKRRQRDRDLDNGVTTAGQERDEPRDKERDIARDSHSDSHADVTEIETRRDETKKPSSRAIPVPPAPRPEYDLGAFDADAWRIAGCGIPGSAGEDLLAAMGKAAAARGKTPFEFAEPFLAAMKRFGDEMRERGVHRGALTAHDVLHKPDKNQGAYLGQILAIVDGKRMGEGSGSAPATPAAGPPPLSEYERLQRLPRVKPSEVPGLGVLRSPPKEAS